MPSAASCCAASTRSARSPGTRCGPSTGGPARFSLPRPSPHPPAVSPRPGVRSRLRAGPGARRAAPHHAEHLHGLRRLQRRPRPRGGLMRAPAIRALGLLSGEGRGPGPAPIWTLPRPERAGDRFRRATRECLLALAPAHATLPDRNAPREEIAGGRSALLYVTAAAYGASNREFIERRGGVTHFAYTAPAVVPAEVAIEFGVTG